MSTQKSSECLAGEKALARGAWTEAREAFAAALRVCELPEALEGLGLAAWWLDLADEVFDSRERAYRLYLARGEKTAAGRLAVWLAWDSLAFRGESAVASGWLQRARRLLAGLPACAEMAWLEVREGSICLLEEGDPVRAQAMAIEGIRIAREVGNVDLEMLGLAVKGLALVALGEVREGMRSLDEVNAAVIAGELNDLVAIGLSSCYMIAACERVRDYDRAVQWCTRLKAFSARWGLRPLFAVCRTQYASICMWRGTWLEAEQELRAASDELAASRPAMTGEALVRLAELRRRQGRQAEATALLNQVHPGGLGLLGHAEVAFDSGDIRAAAEQAARYLRHVPEQNRTERVSGLELLVRALADLGDWERANAAFAELSSTAALMGTVSFRAVASFAAGYLALGNGKLDAARHCFEDAVDLFVKSGAPFEVARARIELARALGKMGRTEAGKDEVRRAIEMLQELKADHEAARAKRVLEVLDAMHGADRKTGSRDSGSSQLTKREMEVLRLVAEGLNNQEIAERLFRSDHTVHRHLANILHKLNVPTRAAAVAQAARQGLLR